MALDFSLLGGFPLKSYSSDDFNTDRFEVGGVGQVLDIYGLFGMGITGTSASVKISTQSKPIRAIC